jgi:acetyl-CoA carboxylase biotin carboxyl carrier protein
MADKDTDIEKIKELIEIMKENGLDEIEIRHDDDKIFLKRSQPQQIISGIPVVRPESGVVPVSPAGTEMLNQPSAQPPVSGEDLIEIKSPIVGTFYATPSPDSEPYDEVGSTVDPQSIVCSIAETSGMIVEILVTNGQAVEYGQVLFKVRPD